MSDMTHGQMPQGFEHQVFERPTIQTVALNAGALLHHSYYFVSSVIAGLLVFALLMAINGAAHRSAQSPSSMSRQLP